MPAGTKPTSTAKQHKIQAPSTRLQCDAAVICKQGETSFSAECFFLGHIRLQQQCPCRKRYRITSEVPLMPVQVAAAEDNRFKRTHDHDKCRWRTELVQVSGRVSGASSNSAVGLGYTDCHIRRRRSNTAYIRRTCLHGAQFYAKSGS